MNNPKRWYATFIIDDPHHTDVSNIEVDHHLILARTTPLTYRPLCDTSFCEVHQAIEALAASEIPYIAEIESNGERVRIAQRIVKDPLYVSDMKLLKRIRSWLLIGANADEQLRKEQSP